MGAQPPGRSVPADRADETVEGEREVSEDLGQPSRSEPQHDLELEQTLGGQDVALGEEQVARALGVDVGNAPSVPKHLDRLSEASQAQFSLHRGQGGAGPLAKHVRQLAQ